MKLYYSPGACSMGIHTLLEEIGKPFEREPVNLRGKEQFAPAYVKLNPKSQVPTLQRKDGSVLTELVAIATWLAAVNPDRKLLPQTPEELARCYEVMLLVNGNMHPQGVTRIYRTDKFTPNEADYEAIRERGREIVKEDPRDIAARRAVLPGPAHHRRFRDLLHGVLDRASAEMDAAASLRGAFRSDAGASRRAARPQS